MKFVRHVLLLTALLIYCNTALTQPIVIATIKPLHSLVNSVMERVAQPILLIDKENSIHEYILRPSDARKLSSSDIIFYIDDKLETFIKNNTKKILVPLSHEVNLLKKRSQLIFSENLNDSNNEDDLHIWLDPENAKIMVRHISKILSSIDSKNAPIYQENANKTITKISAQAHNIKEKLKSVKGKPYIVTHDAYQYFEKYFELSPMASLSQDDEINISFSTFHKIKKIIKKENIHCIFSEFIDTRMNKQMSDKLKMEILDPIGNEIEAGPEAYFAMIEAMTTKLISCLKDEK